MVKLLANHEDKKFQFIRKTWKNSKTHWVKFVITTPFEIVKELAIAVVYQCVRWSITFKGDKKTMVFTSYCS